MQTNPIRDRNLVANSNSPVAKSIFLSMMIAWAVFFPWVLMVVDAVTWVTQGATASGISYTSITGIVLLMWPAAAMAVVERYVRNPFTPSVPPMEIGSHLTEFRVLESSSTDWKSQ